MTTERKLVGRFYHLKKKKIVKKFVERLFIKMLDELKKTDMRLFLQTLR